METAVIAVVCSVAGVILTLYSVNRNKEKDLKEEGRSQGIIDTKLEYISKGVDDIRISNVKQDKRLGDIDLRLIRVEDRAKSNTHRLNDLDGKSYKEKGEDNNVK